MLTPFDSLVLFLGIYLRETLTHVYKDVPTELFNVVLFIIVRYPNQSGSAGLVKKSVAHLGHRILCSH